MDIGVLLAGKYRVERVLGRGGQGEVVQAFNLHLNQPVAIKFLHADLAKDPTIVQRFLREAQSAFQLKSEHVAHVLDMGTLDTGAPYIVFEYLDGADLKSFPRDQLTLEIAVDLILQATEALAEAHSRGIVHRDIKPANLFITYRSDGTPMLKILDFGISKAQTFGLPELTDSIAMMGTPTYMSPEQLMSTRDADHRTDIWSLGVVLYELIEGRVPYDADTLTQLAVKVMTLPLPPIVSNVPPTLVTVIERCLAKDPAQRYQTMTELARGLSQFASAFETVALQVRRAERLATPVPELAPPSGRPRWFIPVIAGAAAGTAAVVAVIAFSGGNHEGSRDAAPVGEVHQMAVAPPAPVTAPPPSIDARDDRPDVAAHQVGDAVTAFVAWTKAHAADPCPELDAISPPAKTDAWGSPLVLTCTQQPADHVAGVISAGPDRALGTADDLRSWELAPELARGPRWNPKPVKTSVRTKTVHPTPPKHDKQTTTQPAIVDRDGDGIPDVR